MVISNRSLSSNTVLGIQHLMQNPVLYTKYEAEKQAHPIRGTCGGYPAPKPMGVA